MKAKIKIYATFVLLFLMASSCSDQFLEDMKNYGDADDTFYQNESRVNWYIGNLYYDFFGTQTSPIAALVGDYTEEKARMTEEIAGIQDLINPTMAFSDADEGSAYFGTKLEAKIKNEPYNRIRDCNELINEIDEKGANLEDEFRNRAKGQAYYLRGIQYFDLMRTYGGVPIVTTVEGASSTDETLKLPRASVAELVDQIVADLDMAAKLLPAAWELSDYGRVTKGAALAQKARVLLTFASPLFNEDWDNTGNPRWQNALEAGLAAEKELTAAGFGLYGSSAKDWADMFVIDNSFCSEAITVRFLGAGNSSSTQNNTWENDIRLSSQGGSGGLEAPKEMIDLFPLADGSRPTLENGYDDFLFFVNRDPRFYRTFAFSGSNWGYKDHSDATVWAYRWLDEANQSYFSDENNVSSPAFVRKMTNTDGIDFQYSGTDIFEYRYAELLLTIAECYAAKGELANCLNYLGQVRERVGIPAANNYGIGTLSDKYQAIEACLYERRVELAYEGKRFWDVQRWMLYNDDATAGNTTCAALGIEPINGTQRTGNYLQFKGVATSEDPLAGARNTFSVDPDASDFLTELQELATFYSDNFVLGELETPLDNVNGDPVQIDWKQNYYIMGLKDNVLTQNPWLEQTIGWKDASGTEGTFDYRK